MLAFSVRTCHEAHELFIYVNIQLLPLTQWNCCIEVSWILIFNFLPYFVRDVLIFDMFAIKLDLIRFNYKVNSQN